MNKDLKSWQIGVLGFGIFVIGRSLGGTFGDGLYLLGLVMVIGAIVSGIKTFSNKVGPLGRKNKK